MMSIEVTWLSQQTYVLTTTIKEFNEHEEEFRKFHRHTLSHYRLALKLYGEFLDRGGNRNEF